MSNNRNYTWSLRRTVGLEVHWHSKVVVSRRMEGTKNGGRAERRPALGEALVSLCAAGQGASCRRELLISPNMQHGSILPITEAERLIACLKLPSPSCSPHSYHLLFLSLSLFLSFPLLPSFLFLSLKKKTFLIQT